MAKVVEGTFYVNDKTTGAATKMAFRATVDPAAVPDAPDRDAPDRDVPDHDAVDLADALRRATTKLGVEAVVARFATIPDLSAVRALEIRPADPPSPLRVGIHVSAQWINGAYYGAIISEIRDDECLAKWDDGHEPTWVRRDRIRFEAPPAEARQLQVGMLVGAQWTDGGFYRATIAEAKDGLFLVRWEDGGEPTWVRPEQIRLAGPAPMPPAILAPGMRVHAALTDGKMYPATVRSIRHGRVEIAWDDRATTSWLLPVQIRPIP
jgi:hypothetical protein